MIGTCRQCEVYLRDLLRGEKQKEKGKGKETDREKREGILEMSRVQSLLKAIEEEGYTVKTHYKEEKRKKSKAKYKNKNNAANSNQNDNQNADDVGNPVGSTGPAPPYFGPNFGANGSLFRGGLIRKLAGFPSGSTSSDSITLEKEKERRERRGGIEEELEEAGEARQGKEREEKTFLVQCRQCEDYGAIGGARAYVQAPPLSLNLCFNRLAGKKEMEESLVHELIHVYDHIVAHRDLRDCEQLAYSEIRAAREAECSEYFRDNKFLCSWFRQWCVKTTAIKATSSLFPNEASQCVNKVFEKAYYDTAPFPKSEVPQSIFHHTPYLKLSIPTTYTPHPIAHPIQGSHYQDQNPQERRNRQQHDIQSPSDIKLTSTTSISTVSSFVSPSSSPSTSFTPSNAHSSTTANTTAFTSSSSSSMSKTSSPSEAATPLTPSVATVAAPATATLSFASFSSFLSNSLLFSPETDTKSIEKPTNHSTTQGSEVQKKTASKPSSFTPLTSSHVGEREEQQVQEDQEMKQTKQFHGKQLKPPPKIFANSLSNKTFPSSSFSSSFPFTSPLEVKAENLLLLPTGISTATKIELKCPKFVIRK